MSNIDKVDKKLRELFESIKYTGKWKSLDMSEKLRFLFTMKKALVKLFEMNAEEEINKINVDFFESRVNERGLNRLVRFDQYIETINKREIQVQMADPEKRAQLIAELRAKIKSVNIDDLE